MKIKTQNTIFKVFLIIYSVFYVMAGINHFRATPAYLAIMPSWIPFHLSMVYLSGVIEILLGLGLLLRKTRVFAAWLIILMLLAFLPVHIDMIQKAPFMMGEKEITPFIAWIRLPIQAILIFWAWLYTKKAK
ncbi:DoxX family protein [Pedobacter changchengzhani]|uniref:DoxX family protein n=1 Tax=Pedobacter changchengzhani TaxID=2529274 RepID=A0A4R5MJ68_9SPHI|nr:DoxX family protein [Pedobacter changchengzhani]TDG35426.1 DoxX family protein [Pedobacter changchengzhani]